MPRIIVWDLDGTLLDTLGDLAAAVNGERVHRGLPALPVERVREAVGWGLAHLVDEAFADARPAPRGDAREELIEAVRARYRADHRSHTDLFPGVAAVVDAAKAAGAWQAVLSNKPEEFVVPLVEAYLPGRFDEVRGQRPDVPAKPDPTALRALVAEGRRAVGAAGAEGGAAMAVLVGDSEIDLETARSAGVVSVAVTWGFRPAAALGAADVVCHDVASLARYLTVG